MSYSKLELSFTNFVRSNGKKEEKEMQNYWDTKIQKKSDSYWDKMEPERSWEISYVNHTNHVNI